MQRIARATSVLLDHFEKVPRRAPTPPTFMDVSGYPHYENVCSNILAFFLDPEKPHGLGTLFLDSLARAANLRDCWDSIGSGAVVEREQPTARGNRIDILIRSDFHAILIEHKVFAPANNPFDDYSDYLETLRPERPIRCKLLLTPAPTHAALQWGFINVTHARLVGEIRNLLGNYLGRADTRYLTFMLDFLNTLEGLPGGTVMDKSVVDLLAGRQVEVTEFLDTIKAFKDELRVKVSKVAALIDVKELTNVRQWLYREAWGLTDTVVHDVKVSEQLAVAVDTVVGPDGWRIEFFARRADQRNDVRELLQHLGLPFEPQDGRFMYSRRFKYEEVTDNVAREVQDLIHRIRVEQRLIAPESSVR